MLAIRFCAFLFVWATSARPLVHLFLPPWNSKDKVFRTKTTAPGVQWRPGPQMMSFGLDPATAVHSMLDGVDLVRNSNSNPPDFMLRLNFTNDMEILRHREVVLRQRRALGFTTESSEQLRKLIDFASEGYRALEPMAKTISILLPAEPSREETNTSLYLNQIAEPAESLLPTQIPLDQLGHPTGITFHEGMAYIVDEFNSRILQVKPGQKHGEVFFGGKGRGNDLDQLDRPASITFQEGMAYIADTWNHRILQVRPGQKHGEVFFGGKGFGNDLDQVHSPGSITFHEGMAYIADTSNNRILQVKPGQKHGEVFFDGKGSGNDLDQLSSPASITFQEGMAYIVDSWNHRILQVKPGQKQGEAFFGGKGRGNDLDQLHHPESITFHEGMAYIVDSWNHRILQVKPGQKHGEVFFDGKGSGNDLDQLYGPTSITFQDGMAYIADTWNHRILQVKPGQKQGEAFFGGKGSGNDLDQLDRPASITFQEGMAYIVDSWNDRILLVSNRNPSGVIELVQALGHCEGALRQGGDEHEMIIFKCENSLPFGAHIAAEDFPAIQVEPDAHLGQNLSVAVTDAVLHLPEAEMMKFQAFSRPVAVNSRTLRFYGILGALAFVSIIVHALGRTLGHCFFLVIGFGAFLGACHSGYCFIPFSSGWTSWCILILMGLCVPWAVVPFYFFTSFQALTDHAFTSSEPLAISCASGTAWEWHVFTAFLIAFSTSLWALHLGDPKVKEPLLAIPKCAQSCMAEHFPSLKKEAEEPKVCTRRVMQVIKWAYSSMGDQYLDLMTCLVFRACGYPYANIALQCVLAAIVMQNLGTALHIICSAPSGELLHARWWMYALATAIMAPPVKELDDKLARSGTFHTCIRILTEDAPQLFFQVHFTFSVYWNPIVFLSLSLTIFFALLDLKSLWSKFCATQDTSFRLLGCDERSALSASEQAT